MFPGIVFVVLSIDPDRVADIADLLRSREAEVFVASSRGEYGTDIRRSPV